MEKQNVVENVEGTATSSTPQVATSGTDTSAQQTLEAQVTALAAQVSQLLQAQGRQSQASLSQPNGTTTTDPNTNTDNTQNWNSRWDQQSQTWLRSQNWYDGWQSWQQDSWQQRADWNDRPYISHLKIPEFNGDVKDFLIYSWRVKNLKLQVSPKDDKYFLFHTF